MFRNLTAIEITEGALLADIAVLLHFLSVFMPIGSNFFALLTFAIFAILVLRRGTYVGLMGMCVAIFLLCVLVGPQSMFAMLAEGGGGIYLGYTMKHRFHPLLLVILGIILGTLFSYSFIVVFGWLSGVGIDTYVQSAKHAYQLAASFVGLIAQRIGYGTVWQQQISPPANALAAWSFQHWSVSLFGFLLIVFSPVVVAAYAVVNALVILLGYDVQPLLGRRLRRLQKILKSSVSPPIGDNDESASDDAAFD